MMNSFYKVLSSLLLSIGLIGILQSNSFAQNYNIFFETMGNGIGTKDADSYTGYDSSGVATYSGTGDVDLRTTNASSGYTDASGGHNIMINKSSKSFTVSDINIAGAKNIQLAFGLRKGTKNSDGTEFKIEASVDGGLPIPITFTPLSTGSGTAIWHWITASTIIPNGSSLSLIFSSTSNIIEFRLDDILITSSSPLPIILSSFTANKVDELSFLTWSTSKEINSSHFEIQRGQDGKTFNSIGKVNSKNLETVANYSFLDNSKLSGTVYYRLKSVDFDGKFEISKIVSVDFVNKNNLLELAATLVNQQLSINISNSEEGPLSYFITDLNGRILLSAENISISESTQLEINVFSLPAGMYLLKTKLANSIQAFKFVKQ